jgi:hypothetical protein
MPAACSLVSRLDAEGVDHDVLGGRSGRHQQRADRHRERRRHRSRCREDDRDGEQKLRKHEPAAPPAEPAREPWHVEGVHQRRPEKLDRVGQADEGEQADGAEIDAAVGHPKCQRGARERQRQPGGKAEEEDDQNARA